MPKRVEKRKAAWGIAWLLAVSLVFIGGCTQTLVNEVSGEAFIVIDEPVKAALPTESPIPLSSIQTVTAQTATAEAVPLLPMHAEANDLDGVNEPASLAQSLRIRAVGDLMMHGRQLKNGKTEGGFDFSTYFAQISYEIKAADLAIGNLEAPIGTDNFSGYPRFNAPAAYVKVIQEAGFDAVSLANNHIFDNGIKGLLSTTEHLRAFGLLYEGAGSKEELGTPLIIEKNGIKLALLAYAQSTNTRPKDADSHINMLRKETVERDILLARQSGADFILAFVHWGSEYTSKPSSFQIQWAQTLADAGVDAILGCHPHVLQPIATVTASDGRAVFCAYSMGNFMSNQPDFPRYVGAIVELVIEKDAVTGKCNIKQSGFIPTWICRYTNKGRSEYRVLRSNLPVPFEDEKLMKWASKRADGALKHAIEVLGANGAQMIY